MQGKSLNQIVWEDVDGENTSKYVSCSTSLMQLEITNIMIS